MKKYTSGEFVATKYGIYKAAQDVITSFPSTIIANGGNVAPWAIYGNENSGDYVGTITPNIFDGTLYNYYYMGSDFKPSDFGPTYRSFRMSLPLGTYTLNFNSDVTIVRIIINNNYDTTQVQGPYTFKVTTDDDIGFSFRKNDSTPWDDTITIMLNSGSTALPYEPYGYKIPLYCGENNYTIYMTDVLRKSSGLDPVYDIISSSGTITRNVDTDGTPLVTPTTESFTAPTIATATGNNIINFGTTVKPSKMELMYTGWHMYDDKKYSGGEWG